MLKSLRWVIFSLPVLLALLTVWSAKQAKDSRQARHDAFVIASSAKKELTLNPYLPSGEVDMELRKLLHASPIQSDAAQGLVPDLFEKWEWTQMTTFYFAKEEEAKKAEEKIRAAASDQWKLWALDELEVVGTQMNLAFAKPGATGPMAVFQQILEFGPLPVEQWRVELASDAPSHHEFFLQNALEKEQVKRVRFVSDKLYFMEVCGETVRLMEELQLYFQNHPKLEATIRPTGRQAMIHRPEFNGLLREGVKFHDGTPVTLADIERTMKLVYGSGWLPDRRDAWNLIDGFEVASSQHLRVRFRELYGPSIQLFVDLPILPSAWIDKYEQALNSGVNVFRDHPPAGAGSSYLEMIGERSLSVAIADPKVTWPKRIQLLFGQSDREIRTGFEMREVDAFWPLSESINHIAEREEVNLSRQASINRLLVLWNCRSAPFDQVEVREAMALGLDRQKLIRQMLHGQGRVHEGIFSPESWLSSLPKSIDYDLESARKKLYDLGWVRNEEGYMVKNQQVLSFTLLTVAGNEDRNALAKLLQEEWKVLGVKVNIEQLPLQDLVGQKLQTREFDAALMGFNYETSWDQYLLWHSSQAIRGLNFSGIISPSIDSILNSLRQEYQVSSIQSLAKDLEKEIVQLNPFLTLFCAESTLAVRRQSESKISGEGVQISRLLGGAGK